MPKMQQFQLISATVFIVAIFGYCHSEEVNKTIEVDTPEKFYEEEERNAPNNLNIQVKLFDNIPISSEALIRKACIFVTSVVAIKQIDGITESPVNGLVGLISEFGPARAALQILVETLGDEINWNDPLEKTTPELMRRWTVAHDLSMYLTKITTISSNLISLTKSSDVYEEQQQKKEKLKKEEEEKMEKLKKEEEKKMEKLKKEEERKMEKQKKKETSFWGNKEKIQHQEKIARLTEISLVEAHSNIAEIINKLAEGKSHFRSYPTFILPILFVISPYVTLLSRTIPELANGSKISCKLAETISEYFLPTLLDRLNKIELQVDYGSYLQHNKYRFIHETLNIAPTGNTSSEINCERGEGGINEYNELAKKFIHTRSFPTAESRLTGRIVHLQEEIFETNNGFSLLKDTLGDMDEYYRDAKGECAHDYMALVRYRLETAFGQAFKVVNQTCSRERKPTGK